MSVLGDLYVRGVRCTPADGGFVSVERDPRGAECKHGIAGALEDGAICSGCVAERNAGEPTRELDVDERLRLAVREAVAPHIDERGRVPNTPEVLEAIRQSLRRALVDMCPPPVLLPFTEDGTARLAAAVREQIGALHLGDLILDPVDVQITPVDVARRELSIGFTATLDIPLAERIATIPREVGETWGDYAARRGYPRSDYPPGELGLHEWHEHLAWLAGEDAPDQG